MLRSGSSRITSSPAWGLSCAPDLRRTSSPIPCWRGDTTGLGDTSRSGVDMSLGAQLKKRGYSFDEMVAILRIFPHGAGAEQDDRYFRRIWERAAQQQDKPGEADKPKRDWSAAAAHLCLSVTAWLE